MRCKHQQPLRLSASARSLHIYGSWSEGVLAVRGGLSGADRLLCFARRPPGPALWLASSVRASRPAFLLVSRWVRQDGAKHLLPSFDYCPHSSNVLFQSSFMRNSFYSNVLVGSSPQHPRLVSGNRLLYTDRVTSRKRISRY